MPAGWLAVVGGEVDGLDGGTEQMLGVQRLARLGGQAVPDLRSTRLAVGDDDPSVFELAQALAERLGSDPGGG